MATAKHNFCTDRGESKLIEMCLVPFVVNPANSSKEDLISDAAKSFMEIDVSDVSVNHEGSIQLKDNVYWKYGRDIASFRLQDEPALKFLFDKGYYAAFDTVGPDFEIEEGMTIGIMACNASENILVANGMKEAYAKKDYTPQLLDTFVVTGVVMYVGKNHIEYKTNTVPGISGGGVFLLPGDCESHLHMKLIAVHAGYSESLDSNFGFKLAGELAKYA
jgi:hypothetical protein